MKLTKTPTLATISDTLQHLIGKHIFICLYFLNLLINLSDYATYMLNPSLSKLQF